MDLGIRKFVKASQNFPEKIGGNAEKRIDISVSFL